MQGKGFIFQYSFGILQYGSCVEYELNIKHWWPVDTLQTYPQQPPRGPQETSHPVEASCPSATGWSGGLLQDRLFVAPPEAHHRRWQMIWKSRTQMCHFNHQIQDSRQTFLPIICPYYRPCRWTPRTLPSVRRRLAVFIVMGQLAIVTTVSIIKENSMSTSLAQASTLLHRCVKFYNCGQKKRSYLI